MSVAKDEMHRAMRYRYSLGVPGAKSVPCSKSSKSEIVSQKSAPEGGLHIPSLESNSKVKQLVKQLEEDRKKFEDEQTRLQEKIEEGEKNRQRFISKEESLQKELAATSSELTSLRKTMDELVQHDPAKNMLDLKRDTSHFDRDAQMEREIKALRLERATLKQTVANQHAEAAELKSSLETVKAELKDTASSLSIAETANASLSANIVNLTESKSSCSALQEKLDELEAEKDKALENLVARVAENTKMRAQVAAIETELIDAQKKYSGELEARKRFAKELDAQKKIVADLEARKEVAGADTAAENSDLKRRVAERDEEMRRMHEVLTEANHDLIAQSEAVERLKKQAGPTKDKLAEAEQLIARLEAQVKAVSSDRDFERSSVAKQAKAVADERAAFAEERLKLQKKIDALNKDFEDQKQAFWDAAVADTSEVKPKGKKKQNSNNAHSNEDARVDALNKKVLALENKLKESQKEQEVLRCRVKDSQAEVSRVQRKAKTLEKAAKQNASTMKVSVQKEERARTFGKAMSNLGSAHYILMLVALFTATIFFSYQ